MVLYNYKRKGAIFTQRPPELQGNGEDKQPKATCQCRGQWSPRNTGHRYSSFRERKTPMQSTTVWKPGVPCHISMIPPFRRCISGGQGSQGTSLARGHSTTEPLLPACHISRSHPKAGKTGCCSNCKEISHSFLTPGQEQEGPCLFTGECSRTWSLPRKPCLSS